MRARSLASSAIVLSALAVWSPPATAQAISGTRSVQPSVRLQAPIPQHGAVPAATPAAGAPTTVSPARPRRFTPLAAGAHVFYGRIAKINGMLLVVQTRRNRLVTVDATNAIAAGTYSAPLFVGKLVSVDGTMVANGAFQANHITRVPTLNGLRDDR